jgi:hypothetical protein
MSANSKPWTVAIQDLLADGEWHTVDEALTVGAAQVDDARALQEMGSKQTSQPEERRLQIGRRNVAQQAITGMLRFGKAQRTSDHKQIRQANGGKSAAVGPVQEQVDELKTRVEVLEDAVQSMQAQLDRLDGETESSNPVGEKQTTFESLIMGSGSKS